MAKKNKKVRVKGYCRRDWLNIGNIDPFFNIKAEKRRMIFSISWSFPRMDENFWFDFYSKLNALHWHFFTEYLKAYK